VPSRTSIVEHVHQLSTEHGLAVLWATHLIDEIYNEDQIIILHKGEIKAKGNIERVLNETNTQSINEAFNFYTQGERV
jgi:ABC-2 type transport system ATP-binding protein